MEYTPQDRALIFKEINASPGMQFLGRNKQRTFILNIFVMNKIELQNELSLVANLAIGMKLMGDEHREAGHQVHREINRRFHNFLAAAKTLIDHTRVFMERHYKGTELHIQYEERIKQDFAKSELCRFIQDLRNYTLHYELPISTMSLEFSRDEGFRSGVYILTEELQQWSGWSSLSRAFLKSQEKEISPSQIVHEYSAKIESFNQWLDIALESHHAQDLAELRALQDEFKRINDALSQRSATA
jgi:hypothetical protein